ncbi:MAG: hypothetical protein AAF108_10245 [Planctomycetota bacterium]
MLTRHDLYDLCVQSPADLVPLLRAVHGGEPRVLVEHFAASARISRRWVETDHAGKAVAIDLDAEVLSLTEGVDRVRTVHADVLDAAALAGVRGDIVHAGNFSIGYHHDRPALVRYLGLVREQLEPGGVFVCDTYGGESAFHIGSMERDCPIPAGFVPSHGPPSDLPAGAFVRYTWEQREADPLTGRVLDVLHFRVFDGHEVVHEVTDAFVYDWRLWSPPELRDAMLEVGFASVECYNELPDAVDDDGRAYATPVDGEDLNESFIVCLAARTS